MTVTGQTRLSQALEHAQAHEGRRLERLVEYLTHPTVSAGDDDLRVVARWLVAWLQRLGFDAGLGGRPSHPLVIASRRDRPDAPTVLLYGHYDVQPTGDEGLWRSPPFSPRVEDGRIYARGAADNKGQHFAQLLAIESLLETAGELPCNVVVALDGEEEIGSPSLDETVRAHRAQLAADVVVLADGPAHAGGRARIIAGCRGCLSFELSVTTASRDLHSGNWGGVAPNAAWELVQALAALRAPSGELTVPGLEPPEATAPGLRARAAELPVDLDAVCADAGIERLDAPAARPFHERLMAWPALSINAFTAGPEDVSAAGMVVPARASARCDLRLVPGQSPDDAFDRLRDHLARAAPCVRLRRTGGAMAPALSSPEAPELALLVEAVTRGQGTPPVVEPVAGGSLPLATWQEQLGAPAYVVTYADHDCRAHGPDENLTVDAFQRAVRSGIATLALLGGDR